MAFIPTKHIQDAQRQESQTKENLDFKKEEIEFLIAKLSDTDFKGREVEILYGILVKLQEQYKRF